jgi:hypothetical protein
MSSPVLMCTVLVLMMAKALAAIYLGDGYVCRSCGARRDDRHSDDCQWS